MSDGTGEDVRALFARSRPLLLALGDERRQAIVALLIGGSRALSVQEIATGIALSQPAASHHLKILREAGLLTVERRGTQHLYSLNTDRYADVLAPLRNLVDTIIDCAPPDRGG